MSKLALTLGKVMIAAAWADGEVSHEEINTLKWLLLRLRSKGRVRGTQLTGQEWAELEIYLANPITPEERERLVVELQHALRSEAQKKLAVEALQEVMAADGDITTSEQAVLDEIQATLAETPVGMVGAFNRLLGGRMREQRAAVAGAPNREEFFEDFLRNKVYYLLTQHASHDEVSVRLSDEELRRLGLAGGLMAKVAHTDGAPVAQEIEAMRRLIQEHWTLSEEAAAFVADVALSAIDKTYDTTRLMDSFARTTAPAERRQFLEALFAVAAANGEISMEEHEELRLITRGIRLTHRDFIDAKRNITES